MVQLLPTATVVFEGMLQVLEVIVKSVGFAPLSATEEIVKGPVPEFVTVNATGELAVPTFWGEKR